MEEEFHSAVKERRTIIEVGNEISVPIERIREIIEESLKYTPTAFNSQSARIALLLGEEHERFWEVTREHIIKNIQRDRLKDNIEKINAFKNGYGTILFFEDLNIIEYLEQDYSTYREYFPVWAHQSNGMLQFIIWTSLEIEGLGASLQHFNTFIDRAIKEKWKLPDNWKLIAEMPFGNPISIPAEKHFQKINERYKEFK
jgi:Predicted oxidoreductase related to nitroreductase